MTEYAYQIKGLQYRYPNSKQMTLRGVDLSVQKGEFVTIVGKMSSGKTTLLKHMNGIIKPEKGDVLINGRSVADNPDYPYHQEVSLLFENPEDQLFYPVVSDDIAFGPRNLNIQKGKIDQRVIQVCRRLEILELMDRQTSTLSYGEKTLVALAGIMAMKTEIILLDTPEVGIDLWSKSKLMTLIDELSADHTLVIATNDVGILERSDTINLLWNGKIRGEYKTFQSFKDALSK